MTRARALRPRALRLRYGLDYGRMVNERTRFALNEALNVYKTSRYTLRGGELPVSLRHHPSPDGTPSNDTWTLREIFRDGCYTPPPAVDELLRAAEPGPAVVDLGANVGLFAALMLGRYPSSRVTAFEPDPDSARLFRTMLERGDLAARCQLHESVAAAAVGTRRFAHGQHQFSHVADRSDGRVIEVPAVDVLPFLAGADLAKIDIEGGEWELLADPRFGDLGPHSVVLEHHPRLCPEPERHGELAERLLERHGYRVLDMPAEWRAQNEPILWAVRRGTE